MLHTQWLLVEAVDSDEAVVRAENLINAYLNENSADAWFDSYKMSKKSLLNDGVAKVEDVPKVYKKIRKEAMNTREGIIGQALLFGNGEMVTKILENYRADNPKCASEYNLDNINKLNFMKNAIAVALNRWTEGSVIFDLEQNTANLYMFKKRYKENPARQYMVEFQFHS